MEEFREGWLLQKLFITASSEAITWNSWSLLVLFQADKELTRVIRDYINMYRYKLVGKDSENFFLVVGK